MNNLHRQISGCPPCRKCPDEEGKLDWVGDIALFLSVASILPQIWHVWSKKDARSLSYIWMTTAFLANVLWIIYALDKGVDLIVCTGMIFATVYVILASMKYSFGH
jgi:uncharacterized protein with PQ loop repeat